MLNVKVVISDSYIFLGTTVLELNIISGLIIMPHNLLVRPGLAWIWEWKAFKQINNCKGEYIYCAILWDCNSRIILNI